MGNGHDYRIPEPTVAVQPCPLCAKDKWHALTSLANLRNDGRSANQFSNRHPGYTGSLWIMLARDYLRRIWEGKEDASELAARILCGEFARSESSTSVEKGIMAGIEKPGASLPLPISIDWSHQEFVYRWQFGVQRDLYQLLLVSKRARKCERANCPTPFFVAKKLPRRYCGKACADEAVAETKEAYEASGNRPPRREKKNRKGRKGQRP